MKSKLNRRRFLPRSAGATLALLGLSSLLAKTADSLATVQATRDEMTVYRGLDHGIHGGCKLSWTRSGVRVPPITNPAEVIERLFSNESPQRRRELVKENGLQGAILDAIKEEAKGLAKKVNREDQEKLDEYFTSIQDVQAKVNADGGGLRTLVVESPTVEIFRSR